MKKIILSAAIVCTCIGGAFAQSSSTPYTGNYSIQIQDFITLTPSGVQGTLQTLSFNTPTQQQNGLPVNAVSFVVAASRSWTATHMSTDFARVPTQANPAISNTAPTSIYKIWVNGLTSGTTTPIASVAPGTTSTNAVQTIAANPTGGVSQGFTLNGFITPGFATNLSGTYTNTITVVASLN